MRVLIAEDYEPLRYVMSRMLANTYDVVAVAAAQDIVPAVNECHPDLALLDISLPGGSGMAAARQLRSITPELKVVFVTAHTDAAYVRQARESGASGYLLKNALATELLQVIERVFAGGEFVVAGFSPPGGLI